MQMILLLRTRYLPVAEAWIPKTINACFTRNQDKSQHVVEAQQREMQHVHAVLSLLGNEKAFVGTVETFAGV